ncbi:MAG: C1 family peptidase, partial [Pseudomonadota bacterium]
PSFVYAIADNFEAVKYFRHDVRPTTGDDTLASVKKYLAAGVPSMFGYWTFPSHELGDAPGSIPYPCSVEESDGGHALVAVGYDDEKEIVNTVCNEVTKGALLVRNSWGDSWGQQGYGWFPYQYVTDELADEFWSLLSMDWVETGKFG